MVRKFESLIGLVFDCALNLKLDYLRFFINNRL